MIKKAKFRDRVIPESKAIREMKRIGVAPYGIKIMKDKTVFRLVLLKNVRPAMSNILKENMLSTGGDAAVHKLACACKVDSTDVLLMGTVAQYRHLLNNLKLQPYGGKEMYRRILKKLGRAK